MSWSNLSLSLKILICFLFIVFLLSGFSLILCYLLIDIGHLGMELVEENILELLLLSRWKQELLLTRTALEHFLEAGSLNPMDLAGESDWRWDLVFEPESVPEALEELKRDLEWIMFTYNNKVKGLLRYKNFETAEALIKEELLPNILKLEDRLDHAYQETYGSITKGSGTISKHITRALILLFIISTVAIFLSIFFAYRLSLSLMKPIEKVIDKVKRISSGEYGLQIAGHSQYELRRLIESINQMSASLHTSFTTLSREKQFREQIVESLPIGIITVQDDGEKIEVNNEALRLLGKTREELDSYLHQEQFCTKNKELWNWFYSQEFFQTRKTEITNGKETFQVIVSQTPLLENSRKMIGRIFYFMDVSELDRLEKQIYNSEKLALVGELAAGSAHEIRNPLTIIQGFLQLMNASLDEEELKKFHVPLILEELDRINQIVEEMLMLAKPGVPQMTEMDLQELIRGILPLFSGNLPSNVSLSVDVHSVQVMVDTAQFKQVFYNLFRNSLEAMGEQGKIRLFSKLTEEEVHIYVDDDGPGIPDELKDDIFEPFVSTKKKGTGLGLAIIRRIIESHQGRITLVDKEERGTRFKISLPRVNK